MKNKILATLVAFGLVGSASAIDINDNLSITGFVDGSYNNIESDTTPATSDTQQIGIDEVELNFLFNVSNVSAEIHIDDTASEGLNIEQAHFSYSLENGVNFTFGRFGSALGFEREDPSGVYASSRAYSDASGFNLGNVDFKSYDGLVVGYDSDVFSISGAFVNPTADRASLEDNDIDLELSVVYTGIENFNIGVGYYFDNQEKNEDEMDVLNFHASTTFGKFFVAAEYSEIKKESIDRDAYMVLADYDISDKFGIAARLSSYEEGAGSDVDKLTIAPNYSITDSLGLIVEYSDIDSDKTEEEIVSVELTFTF
jgi:hypothetical protein